MFLDGIADKPMSEHERLQKKIKNISVNQPFHLHPSQVQETLEMKILGKLQVENDKKMPKYNTFANIRSFEKMANLS
jgi:hypothetical protein